MFIIEVIVCSGVELDLYWELVPMFSLSIYRHGGGDIRDTFQYNTVQNKTTTNYNLNNKHVV